MWRMKFKMSLSFLQNPRPRKKKEQPAPTSKPGGGGARQCGTPWHPSAQASAAAVAATPLRGMDRAQERDGSADPGRGRTPEQPWPHRPPAARRLAPRERLGKAELGPALSQVPAGPCHFSPSEEEEEGVGSGDRDANARLAEATRAAAAFVRGEARGGGRGGVAARRPPRVRSRAAPSQAPLRAAAAEAPAAAAKRGLGSAQLLSNYPSTNLAAT